MIISFLANGDGGHIPLPLSVSGQLGAGPQTCHNQNPYQTQIFSYAKYWISMHIFSPTTPYQSIFNFLLWLFAFVLASLGLGPNISQSNVCLPMLDLDFFSPMTLWTFVATLVAVHFTPDLISSLGHQFLDATITLLPPCIRTTFLAMPNIGDADFTNDCTFC